MTFPSTEFEIKHAIDKIVAMVADRRKRVRLAALEALAVLSQIYESEVLIRFICTFFFNKNIESNLKDKVNITLTIKWFANERDFRVKTLQLKKNYVLIKFI